MSARQLKKLRQRGLLEEEVAAAPEDSSSEEEVKASAFKLLNLSSSESEEESDTSETPDLADEPKVEPPKPPPPKVKEQNSGSKPKPNSKSSEPNPSLSEDEYLDQCVAAVKANIEQPAPTPIPIRQSCLKISVNLLDFAKLTRAGLGEVASGRRMKGRAFSLKKHWLITPSPDWPLCSDFRMAKKGNSFYFNSDEDYHYCTVKYAEAIMSENSRTLWEFRYAHPFYVEDLLQQHLGYLADSKTGPATECIRKALYVFQCAFTNEFSQQITQEAPNREHPLEPLLPSTSEAAGSHTCNHLFYELLLRYARCLSLQNYKEQAIEIFKLILTLDYPMDDCHALHYIDSLFLSCGQFEKVQPFAYNFLQDRGADWARLPLRLNERTTRLDFRQLNFAYSTPLALLNLSDPLMVSELHKQFDARWFFYKAFTEAPVLPADFWHRSTYPTSTFLCFSAESPNFSEVAPFVEGFMGLLRACVLFPTGVSAIVERILERDPNFGKTRPARVPVYKAVRHGVPVHTLSSTGSGATEMTGNIRSAPDKGLCWSDVKAAYDKIEEPDVIGQVYAENSYQVWQESEHQALLYAAATLVLVFMEEEPATFKQVRQKHAQVHKFSGSLFAGETPPILREFKREAYSLVTGLPRNLERGWKDRERYFQMVIAEIQRNRDLRKSSRNSDWKPGLPPIREIEMEEDEEPVVRRRPNPPAAPQTTRDPPVPPTAWSILVDFGSICFKLCFNWAQLVWHTIWSRFSPYLSVARPPSN